jgi:FeS assembly protein IscX
MRLSWSHQADVAAALLEAYPETDRLALNHDRLLKLILALPGFDDLPSPPRAACLDHILWTWMRLSDGAPAETGAC